MRSLNISLEARADNQVLPVQPDEIQVVTALSTHLQYTVSLHILKLTQEPPLALSVHAERVISGVNAELQK